MTLAIQHSDILKEDAIAFLKRNESELKPNHRKRMGDLRILRKNANATVEFYAQTNR